MKQVLFVVLFLFCKMLSAQELIGTPTSLILVYNYPGANFYLELKGVEKMKTENQNVFIIDKKMVQIKILNKIKFIGNTKQNLTFVDFINEYVDWEKSYLEKTLSFNINSNIKCLKSVKGRDFAFWTYDMPINKQKETTDSSITTPTQKQMFVLTRIKDYMVGINSPLFEDNQFDLIKNYLITNIDGIIESDNEINVEELNKKMNKL